MHRKGKVKYSFFDKSEGETEVSKCQPCERGKGKVANGSLALQASPGGNVMKASDATNLLRN